MVPGHGGPLHGPPFRVVAEGLERPPDGREQRGRRIRHERKTVLSVGDSVCQPAYGPYDWQRSIQLAVHLIQPARFKPRWHQEEVRTGLDEVRERFIEANLRADAIRPALGQVSPHRLVPRLARSKNPKRGVEA